MDILEVNTDDARSVGLVGGSDVGRLLGRVDQVLVDAAGTAASVSRNGSHCTA
ncbi:hypothetical protein [Pseudonocardia cypriaca]|uniref:Uncharacterized protein n=1 Tax=Pseudonocardia cypriaca TaxID=882449 RepID=A0A543GCH7_9PSEU|nr:hypothetical protein [Pseudonocardia cypriaca]TQM43787.1 hypothetical protein FB388_1139 [Pseudonocardia cypriaca]